MSSVELELSIDARPHFLQALRRVLRPIVRLMIRSGVRYDEFANVARCAYVESAVRDGIGEIKDATRDEIAWATGINRERVDHYIEGTEPLPGDGISPISLMSEVLHKWYTDPKYLGPSGAPLEIEIDAASAPNFCDLVTQIDANASPAPVLEELLRAGAVTHCDAQRIRAVTRCFIWPKGAFPLFQYFGVTLAQLIETHEHNLTCTDAKKKRLERSVFAERGLSEQLLPSFHAFAKERADQFLADLDDWLGGLAHSLTKTTGPRMEAGVNVYFYMERPTDTQDLTALVQYSRCTIAPDDPTDP
jgi:hypothetical protein